MVLAVDGAFSFTGDPVGFTLFAEAERIHSAYQFDPLFAVNCSVVDPLPHQVEAQGCLLPENGQSGNIINGIAPATGPGPLKR